MPRVGRNRANAAKTVTLALVATAALAGCSAHNPHFDPLGTSSAAPAPSSGSLGPSTTGAPTESATAPPTATPTPTDVETVPPLPSEVPSPSHDLTVTGVGPQLDIGGRTILPGHRIVAEYGVAGGPGLGILGAGTPTQAAAAVAARVAVYAGQPANHEPVVGAMELIATVALGGPGPTGQYSSLPDIASISTYLAAAKAHHELLVLDFQPGRASFIEQVEKVRSLLLDPDVSVALDPEWKVGPTQVPGNGFIGSASAADVNAVGDYLAQLVAQYRLPQKLLVIHQFALSMLPDRSSIVSQPGLAVVFHADGEGSIPAKLGTYHALAFPGAPFYAGFKVFLTEDTAVMTPAAVLALPRVPDLITYQ